MLINPVVATLKQAKLPNCGNEPAQHRCYNRTTSKQKSKNGTGTKAAALALAQGWAPTCLCGYVYPFSSTPLLSVLRTTATHPPLLAAQGSTSL